MIAIKKASQYLLETSAEDIAIRLVPYFYLYQYIGKPIKNYAFAITFCSLAGPFNPSKLMKDETLKDLLKITNYGTTSPNLGSQIENWVSRNISEDDWDVFLTLDHICALRVDEIADIADALQIQVRREDYLVGEMIPELVPLGNYNAGRRWPRI